MSAHVIEVEPFKKWLAEKGAEVLVPTNPYELVRFRTSEGTSVIYKKERYPFVTFTGQAHHAYDNFKHNRHVRFCKATPRTKKTSPTIKTLLERDGPNCFYCSIEFNEAVKPTVEHLVALTHGGPQHISNKFLSCEKCNHWVGHLSAPEKIRYRDSLRAKKD